MRMREDDRQRLLKTPEIVDGEPYLGIKYQRANYQNSRARRESIRLGIRYAEDGYVGIETMDDIRQILTPALRELDELQSDLNLSPAA